MKRILKWTGRIALAILILGVILLGGPVAYEMAAGPKAADFTNVTFTAPDGATLRGYLAEPAGEGPHPAVILIHEWWGINDDITALADRLAAEGFVVLAPDAYRGRTTSQVPRALYLRLSTPQEVIDGDLDAALSYVRSLNSVAGERVAVWGFCFGGTQALAMGTRHEDLAAVVDFYGGGPITDPAALGELSGPVLGVFGRDDASIPISEVEAFEAALAARDIPHEITIYDEVGHAFLDSENIDEPGPPAQAWRQAIDFLKEELANS